LKFGIERDGNITEKVLIPEPMGRINTGTSLGAKASSVTLTTVEPGMPAAQAGIKVGDSILTANGQNVPHLAALIQLLTRTKDQPLQLGILRNGQKLSFTVKPILDSRGSASEARYRIGVASVPTKVISLPFPQALQRSLADNKKSSFLILELLQKMVQRKVSMRQVDGPSESAAPSARPPASKAGPRSC